MAARENNLNYGAYCGIYCGACAIMVATERDEVAKLLEHEEPGYTVEDLTCLGCRTDVTASWCTDCEMRLCARERALAFCCDCDDYPCELNKRFQADEHPHHTPVLKNLEAIREAGAAAWLAAQFERWKCPSCGARSTWYDEKCDGCGAELYDCRAEEKDLAA
ncbi:MAG: DUF3795 domain-containing protein [bacterium]